MNHPYDEVQGDRVKPSTPRHRIAPKPHTEEDDDRALAPGRVSSQSIRRLDAIDEDDQSLLNRLEKGLRIDEHALDEALMDQPDLLYDVSKHLALLISRRDAAKQELATVEAWVDGVLRRAAREQDSKSTEAEIKARLRVDSRVVEATEVYLRLSHAAGQFAALKEAFQQRGYALKDLVALHLASYYGEVSVRGPGVGDVKNMRADQARRGMNELRRQGTRHRDDD